MALPLVKSRGFCLTTDVMNIIINCAVMGTSGEICELSESRRCCEGGSAHAFLTPEHPERAAAAVTGFKRIDSDQ